MEQKRTLHKNKSPQSAQPSLWTSPVELSSLWNPAVFEPLWRDNDVFDAARRNMDLVFGGVFDSWLTPRKQPYADVTEDKKSLRIKMDVPGLEEKDIDISADGGVLTISADKQEEQGGTESRFSFSYSTTLPEGADINQAHVDFANHRLSIEIPKRNGAAPKLAVSKTRHKKHKKARY